MVKKIADIIEKQDTNILNFTTAKFFKCGGDMTVEETVSQFRKTAQTMDVVMYFYIVDEADKLLGVIDIKELLMAEPPNLLKDLMVENVISLKTDCTMKEATNAFIRYGFRALPVTDENNRFWASSRIATS